MLTISDIMGLPRREPSPEPTWVSHYPLRMAVGFIRPLGDDLVPAKGSIFEEPPRPVE